jgi:hypothetical protein
MSDLLYYEVEDGKNHVYFALSDKLRAAIDVGAAAVKEPAPAPSVNPSVGGEDPGYLDSDVPF